MFSFITLALITEVAPSEKITVEGISLSRDWIELVSDKDAVYSIGDPIANITVRNSGSGYANITVHVGRDDLYDKNIDDNKVTSEDKLTVHKNDIILVHFNYAESDWPESKNGVIVAYNPRRPASDSTSSGLLRSGRRIEVRDPYDGLVDFLDVNATLSDSSVSVAYRKVLNETVSNSTEWIVNHPSIYSPGNLTDPPGTTDDQVASLSNTGKTKVVLSEICGVRPVSNPAPQILDGLAYYVELYVVDDGNSGEGVDLAGWSLQYKTAGGDYSLFRKVVLGDDDEDGIPDHPFFVKSGDFVIINFGSERVDETDGIGDVNNNGAIDIYVSLEVLGKSDIYGMKNSGEVLQLEPDGSVGDAFVFSDNTTVSYNTTYWQGVPFDSTLLEAGKSAGRDWDDVVLGRDTNTSDDFKVLVPQTPGTPNGEPLKALGFYASLFPSYLRPHSYYDVAFVFSTRYPSGDVDAVKVVLDPHWHWSGKYELSGKGFEGAILTTHLTKDGFTEIVVSNASITSDDPGTLVLKNVLTPEVSRSYLIPVYAAAWPGFLEKWNDLVLTVRATSGIYPLGIVINEVMYYTSKDEDAKTENAEWIELYNPGKEDVSVSGWRFSVDGKDVFISGVVPAGGFLVLSGSGKDSSGNVQIPPDVPEGANIMGIPLSSDIPGQEWVSLGDHSGVIELYDDKNELIDVMRYDSRYGRRKDFSWEKRHPMAPSNQPQSWCLSMKVGGTPGRKNSCYLSPVYESKLASSLKVSSRAVDVHSSLSIEVVEDGFAELFVSDSTGKIIRYLCKNEPVFSGEVFVWDLRDEREVKVKPGLYFITGRINGKKMRLPVAVSP